MELKLNDIACSKLVLLSLFGSLFFDIGYKVSRDLEACEESETLVCLKKDNTE